MISLSRIWSLKLTRHVVFLAAPVLGLVYSSGRLLQDSDYLPFDLAGREFAGKILSAQGDVKRKPPERLRWFDAAENAKIYSRDVIRTAADGMTRVTLPDGGEILLGPNSLAVFVQEGGAAKVSLNSGLVQFKAGKQALVIESQGKQVRLKAGTEGQGWAHARQLPGEDPETSLKIIRGKAELVGGSGGGVPLHTDVMLNWGSGNQQLVQEVVGEMLEPPLDSENRIAEGEKSLPVRFAWTPADAQLDVALSGDFASPVFSQKIKGRTVVIPLPAGRYRWRVWISGAARPLPARGLNVVAVPKAETAIVSPPLSAPAVAPPTVPVVPASQPPVATPTLQKNSAVSASTQPELVLENAQGTRMSNAFNAQGLEKNLTIRIAWKPYPGARAYKVIFSKHADMTLPFLERTVDKNEYVLSRESLPTLKVFYRIEAKTSDGRVGKSRVTPFVFDFSPPRLVAPPADFVVAKSGSDGAEGSVMMTWEKTNYTEAYRIEIATDPQFRKVVQKKELKENFVLMRKPAPGKYYWRVSSLALPVVSDPSVVRHFTVK